MNCADDHIFDAWLDEYQTYYADQLAQGHMPEMAKHHTDRVVGTYIRWWRRKARAYPFSVRVAKGPIPTIKDRRRCILDDHPSLTAGERNK